MRDKDILKVCSTLGYGRFTKLLNMMFEFGRVPEELTMSTIRLLFKDPTGQKGKDQKV